MTLADNFAHDVAVVLNTAEFAGEVTHYPAGGSPAALTGDFQEDQPQEIDEGRGRRVRRMGTLRVATVRSGGTAVSILRDDEFDINAERWSVVTYFREFGMWEIQLQRSDAIERSAGRVVAQRM